MSDWQRQQLAHQQALAQLHGRTVMVSSTTTTGWLPLSDYQQHAVVQHVNVYVPALRGLMTGIVMMMKLSEIRTFKVGHEKLKQMLRNLAQGGQEHELTSALADHAAYMVSMEVAQEFIDDGEEVRVFADLVDGKETYIIRIIAPGDQGARTMATVVEEQK